MTMMSAGTDPAKPPGRLGDPESTLRTDPRSDQRTVAALDVPAAPPAVAPDSPRAAQLEFIAEAEAGFETVFAALMDELPEVAGLTHRTETIAGPDGNEITLYITRPADVAGPLPGVLHVHGVGW